jgi:hypothetical protein
MAAHVLLTTWKMGTNLAPQILPTPMSTESLQGHVTVRLQIPMILILMTIPMIHTIRPAAHAIGCLKMIVEKVTILVVNVLIRYANGNGPKQVLNRPQVSLGLR